MKKKLEIASLAIVTLYKLYLHAAERGGHLSLSNIQRLFSVTITSSFLQPALKKLIDRGLIKLFPGTYTEPTTYEITGEGISLVQKELNTSSSEIYKISRRDDKWLDEEEPLPVAGKANSSPGSQAAQAPASDRIVTLEHNKPARQKAVDAIQEVIAEAEKSNEFGQLFADPNERIVVLSEMRSAWIILRDEAVARFSTIKNFIADRLAMIVNKIPDAMVGALAKKAIDALEAFIKGMF